MSDLVHGRETSIFWADDEINSRMIWDNYFIEKINEIDTAILDIIRVTLEGAIASYAPADTQIAFGYNVESKGNGIQLKSRSGRGLLRYALGRGVLFVPGSPVVDDTLNLAVQVLGVSNRVLESGRGARLDYAEYFKVSLDGDSYFVKKSKITNNSGFEEFMNLDYVRSAFNGLDYVEVAVPVFAFSSKDVSYIVTVWKDLRDYVQCFEGRANVDDYGNAVTHSSYADDEYSRKFNFIVDVLRKYKVDNDVLGNIFYNPQTKKFFILDLTAAAAAADTTTGNAILSGGLVSAYLDSVNGDYENIDVLKVQDWSRTVNK